MYSSQPPPVRFSQRCLVRITRRLRRCARRWLCHLWQSLKWLLSKDHARKERSLEMLLASTPEQHWPVALDALAREQPLMEWRVQRHFVEVFSSGTIRSIGTAVWE